MSKPLKVGTSTTSSTVTGTSSSVASTATPTKASVAKEAKPKATIARPEEISSPHELTAFVENLLSQLEVRFDDMSSQILDRMNQMSSRVDALETSIQDLINGDIARPATPSTPNPLRSGSESG